jgi:hypothetical protein
MLDTSAFPFLSLPLFRRPLRRFVRQFPCPLFRLAPLIRLARLSNACHNRAPIRSLRHHEKTPAAASIRPQFAQGALFLGIISAPAVFALVFHHENTAVAQHGHEIRIKTIRRRLQPKRCIEPIRQVAYPGFHFIHLIEPNRTIVFLTLPLQLADRPDVVVLESIARFVIPVWRVPLRVELETRRGAGAPSPGWRRRGGFGLRRDAQDGEINRVVS